MTITLEVERPYLSFDGVDDYVKVEHSSSLVLDNITVCVWFMLSSLPADWKPLVTKGHYYYNDWFVWYDPSYHFSNQVVINDVRYICRVGAILSPGIWYYGAWRRDTAGNQAVFINGELKATATDPGGAIDHATDPVYIGTWLGLTKFFPGRISRILLYNRALSDNEIRWNYQNPDSPITSGLVLWMRIDEGSGTTVYDYSGYENHGTIYGAAWNREFFDQTSRLVSLRHGLTSRELERVEFTLVNADLRVGQKVRIRRDGKVFFEGIVYERRKRHDENYVGVEATAYSNLIMYDRHVVYRAYQTGTAAGQIIRDLAGLVSGVDVSNVDDGPSLLSNWEIENQTALDVMRSVARGTNYWLRMRPGNYLYFKPKTTGNPKATIDDAKILRAEYAEDRWKLKNRVIYVGAGGQVLADVSEDAGDLPIVVNDPFLTDPVEAQRRANIRLALNKEYGRQLRIEMSQYDFETLGIDLGDTVTVNLPSLGVNENMYVVEIEYDPRELKYTLTLGGRLELFEEFLQEQIGGDVASRFGQSVKVPEMISTLTATFLSFSKMTSDVKYPVYVNKPPLTLYNAQNVTLDNDGYAVLASGATSGSFEAQVLPPSSVTFINYVKAEWIAEKNDGAISADLMDADGDRIAYVNDAYDTQWLYIKKWPAGFGELTYKAASSWGGSGASASDARLGQLNSWCIKLTPSSPGTDGEIYYPSTQNLGLNISSYRYLRLYLYGNHTSDFAIKIRLCQDASNYLEGSINVKSGTWAKYEAALSTFTKIGSPNTINWISIISPQILLIDSDYVLLPFTYELLRLKFTLSRPSASMSSPQVKAVKIIWREGSA